MTAQNVLLRMSDLSFTVLSCSKVNISKVMAGDEYFGQGLSYGNQNYGKKVVAKQR